MKPLEIIYNNYKLEHNNYKGSLEAFAKDPVVLKVLVSKLPDEIKEFVDINDIDLVSSALVNWYERTYIYNDFNLDIKLRRAIFKLLDNVEKDEYNMHQPPQVWKLASDFLKLLIEGKDDKN